MNRLQWLIVIIASVFLMVWALVNYQNLQRELSVPIKVVEKIQIKDPKISPSIKQLMTPREESSLAMNNEQLWGFAPKIVPKKPNPYEIIFTPVTKGSGTRICVTTSCYEFMGLVGEKALFYDLNVSAKKKTISLNTGNILHKPLRVKKIVSDSVVLLDTKTGTTYEMSLFKIDLNQYAPKSLPKKGK